MMPLTLLVPYVLLLPVAVAPGEVDSAVAVQRAVAEGFVARAAFAEAGEAYVRLAAMVGVDRRGELDVAHTQFDSAYGASSAPRHLCRALQVAEKVVAEGGFDDEEEAKYWREIVHDDLRRLQDDARATRRANCRFAAGGESPRIAVALLPDPRPPPTGKPAAKYQATKADLAPPATNAERRWRAHTAAGSVFTGLGLGFAGVLTGVLVVKGQQAAAMRGMIANAREEGRDFTEEEKQEFIGIDRDGRQATAMAVGFGTASAVSLAVGIAVLATRKQSRRKVALHPYGGTRAVGVMLHVRF